MYKHTKAEFNQINHTYYYYYYYKLMDSSVQFSFRVLVNFTASLVSS